MSERWWSIKRISPFISPGLLSLFLEIFNIEQLLSKPFGKKVLPKGVFKQIGVYVYSRKFLLRFSKMKPTPLEKLEKLEQLRALENGYRIKVISVDYEPLHVETPEDLQKLVEFLSQPSRRSD